MLHRLRVPRWALAIPALQSFLQRLHHLRRLAYPRPDERVEPAVDDAGPGAPRTNAEAPPVPATAPVPAPATKDLHSHLYDVQIHNAAGRYREALDGARDAVAAYPGALETWLTLGQIEFGIEQRRPASSPQGADGQGAPATWRSAPLLREDGALLDMLARPAPGGMPESSLPDREAIAKLMPLAKSLAAENASFALRLEPLRQQLGYRVDALETWIKYEHTKYYMRALALYMRRYGSVAALPMAASIIPEHLRQGFAMNGVARIQMDYLNAAYPEQYQDIYTDFDIATFQRAWRGEPVASEDDRQCRIDFVVALSATDQAMKRFVTERLGRDSEVAVVGSRGPVHEALCLAAGARPTTVRRSPVVNKAKNLATTTFAEWENAPSAFDAAIAAAAVEQAGLGMLGEPLDPDGDLKLMAVLKRMVKPGGLLLLVVPTGPDCTVFNATRIYGDARLKRVLEGWTVLERHRHQEPLLHGRGEDCSLFVLVNAG